MGSADRPTIRTGGFTFCCRACNIGADMKHPSFAHGSGAFCRETGQQECGVGIIASQSSAALNTASAIRIAPTTALACRIANIVRGESTRTPNRSSSSRYANRGADNQPRSLLA